MIADSSLGGAVWTGAYAGPVAQMIIRRNVFWNSTGFCALDGNPNSLWPGDTNNKFTPPPGAPPGVGKPSGHIAVGEAGDSVGGNASTTCYHASCNGWKPKVQCPSCTYHLSPTEMALPMIQELDYNLVDQPINPNMSIPRPHGLGFQMHSRHADADFQRKNRPWESNWTDFVVGAAAAKSVGHTPIAAERIGLGPDFAFDRTLIGRRLMFREGDPGALIGEKNHFEDEDRVRGLVKAPSAGLLSVPPTGAWPNGGFPTAPGAWAVYKNRVFNSGGAKTATIHVRANVAGQCEPPPSPAGGGGASCGAPPAGKKHRFWRIDAKPEYFSSSVPSNHMWDVCTLDFCDSSGASLLPANKSGGGSGKIISNPAAASWPHAPACHLGDTSTWSGIWNAGDPRKGEQWIGWDFGPNAVSVHSVKIKQFDVQYCAGTLAVQWSDDGSCFYDGWFVNASANCPLNTTSSGGTAGVTVSPPAVEPKPRPVTPAIPADSNLSISFSLGAPLVGGGATIGTLHMTKGKPVVGEGMAAADGNVAGLCEYSGTLALPPDDGEAHDLYANFLAGSNATYLLDYFWLRANGELV